MIVIAPASAPQIPMLKLAGVEHPLAQPVVHFMRQYGSTPVSLWRVINGLASTRNPDSRARRRHWRVRYWGAVRELLKSKLLVRHGSLIAAASFAAAPRRPGRRLNNAASKSVAETASHTAGSKHALKCEESHRSKSQVVEADQVSAVVPNQDVSVQTKSAVPGVGDIAHAARRLAKRRREKKLPKIGAIDGVRVRRLNAVRVPGGRIFPAYACIREWVYTVAPDTAEYEGRIFERYRASEVQVIRNCEAQLLGGLKKGRTERPSPRKQAAVRKNGCRPVRPGRRPRGRPSQSSVRNRGRCA